MTILAAIDTQNGAEEVVETGHELADGLEEDLVVLHVVPNRVDTDRGRGAVETVVENALGGTDRAEIRVVVERTIWERDAPSDRIAEQIVTEAEEPAVTYVVLGSRKRSPTGKAIIGSVAQLVLIDTATPVVVVEENG